MICWHVSLKDVCKVNFVSVCSFWTWHIILESVNKLDSNGHDYIPITVIVIVISMLNENYFSTSLFYGLETYPSRSCSNLSLSICLSVRQSLTYSLWVLSFCLLVSHSLCVLSFCQYIFPFYHIAQVTRLYLFSR
jgi:uncharacterized membrane protein YecN with MAPEG domain